MIKGAKEFGEGKADTISGMKAMDDTTLEITLTQPASDFLSILATSFYAPVPEEYASKYKPQTDYSKVYRGAGPYYLEKWTPNKSATFVRNPNWDAATDPLRKAYVDKVEVRDRGRPERRPAADRVAATPTCRSTTSRQRRTCSGCPPTRRSPSSSPPRSTAAPGT